MKTHNLTKILMIAGFCTILAIPVALFAADARAGDASSKSPAQPQMPTKVYGVTIEEYGNIQRQLFEASTGDQALQEVNKHLAELNDKRTDLMFADAIKKFPQSAEKLKAVYAEMLKARNPMPVPAGSSKAPAAPTAKDTPSPKK